MLRVLSLSFRKSVWIGNVQNFCWLFLAVVQWFGVRDFSLYGKSITVCVRVCVSHETKRISPNPISQASTKSCLCKILGRVSSRYPLRTPHTVIAAVFFKETKDLESGKEELSGKQFILLRPAYHVVACALESKEFFCNWVSNKLRARQIVVLLDENTYSNSQHMEYVWNSYPPVIQQLEVKKKSILMTMQHEAKILFVPLSRTTVFR